MNIHPKWSEWVVRLRVGEDTASWVRLAPRHEQSRTLIRIWVDKYEAGAFDEDVEASSW